MAHFQFPVSSFKRQSLSVPWRRGGYSALLAIRCGNSARGVRVRRSGLIKQKMHIL